MVELRKIFIKLKWDGYSGEVLLRFYVFIRKIEVGWLKCGSTFEVLCAHRILM